MCLCVCVCVCVCGGVVVVGYLAVAHPGAHTLAHGLRRVDGQRAVARIDDLRLSHLLALAHLKAMPLSVLLRPTQ